MKTILIRYGELTLKGINCDTFINQLIKNIKTRLKLYKQDINYIKDKKSLELEILNDQNIDNIINILKTIFGIQSISIAIKVKLNQQDEIIKECINLSKSCLKTFKVEVIRKDKSFPIHSNDFKIIIATNILKNNPNLKVNVKDPNNTINVLIKTKATYLYLTKIEGLKGLPVNTSGKVLSLISGGIDSPVASFLSLKRGLQTDYLHFITPPFTTNNALNKVFDLLKVLAKYNISNFNFYVCDFSLILKELSHMDSKSYRIIIMRRMFLKIANSLANKINAKAIITGDSLGQVASQTIESITTISQSSKLPILRPLITYDKDEIINIAKSINTYDISIQPFDDACSLYVPKKPATKPNLEKALWNEQQLFMLEHELEYTIKNNIRQFSLNIQGEWYEIEKTK